jgi:hypothetical protein
MKHLTLTILFSFALCAGTFGQTPTPTPATKAPPNADNTARNANDTKPNAATADQQPNNETDVKLVAAIRKDVVAEKGLSMDAKNCKIVVSGGSVIVRGPVDSAQEKTTIVEIATRNAGKGKVTDELEVKAPKK